MNSSLGVGVVGCGWAAGDIVRAIHRLKNVHVETVFDTDSGRAAALAAKAHARIAANLATLVADPKVEVVYVGLPHALLPPAVEAAISAGKHVLAEKPLALTPVDARRLGRLADKADRRLGVFFELRRTDHANVARKLVSEGAIGTVRAVRIRTLISKRLDYWGNPGALNWRSKKAMAGGGVVMMNSIHQLDMLHYITGLDYAAASGMVATVSAPEGVEVEDSASATLRLSNGALVSLVAAAHSPGARHAETIEIEGTEGRLDMSSVQSRDPLRLFRNATGRWSNVRIRRVDAYGPMVAAYLAAVRGEGPVPASAYDAAAALDAVTAIYRSAETGQTVEIS